MPDGSRSDGHWGAERYVDGLPMVSSEKIFIYSFLFS